MKVNSAIYERTFNLGDYNSEKIGLTADLQKDDNPQEVIAQLKEAVEAAHAGQSPTPLDEESNKKAKKASKKKGKKNAKSNNTDDENEHEDNDDEGDADSSDESDSDDEAADDEDDDSSDSDSDDDEDSKAKSKKSKASGKKSNSDKKDSGKKGKKSKAQHYDRNNENHKEIFSEVLSSVSPEWEESDKLMKRAKTASVEMEGHDFLDADGEVLEDFRDSVEAFMKPKKKK